MGPEQSLSDSSVLSISYASIIITKFDLLTTRDRFPVPTIRQIFSSKLLSMYETILSKLDALSTSLGMIRESQKLRPGENPWGYSGGVREEESREKERAVGLLEKEATSDVESVETTFTMVEKSEVRRA